MIIASLNVIHVYLLPFMFCQRRPGPPKFDAGLLSEWVSISELDHLPEVASSNSPY